MSLKEILDSHHVHRPVLMGILNITPDSFSDGGMFLQTDAALCQARQMVQQGADILDMGAESTRPGSDRLSAAEQIDRLREILPNAAKLPAIISIDTTLAEVAAFALDAGAQVVNDVSAGRDDPEMLPLVARHGAAVVLMHMLGAPKTMQDHPHYVDVVTEVRDFLAGRLAAAEAAGVPPECCIVDPGIGFGKLLEHNLALLAGVDQLVSLGRPILIGASRKRFIGELTGQNIPADRREGTLAACLAAWRGGATIFRVHNVGALATTLKVARAIESAS